MIGIYIRVSTTSQAVDGYSLKAQKERLTAFCESQGWEHYKFYVEEGLSGKNTKRPMYQQLMSHIEKGKINTVLVYKLDRIMRSIGELDKMLKTFDDHNCGFKSATEPFDTTNATGKLFMYIVGAFAQWEIDVSSERISMVLEEKVANEGVWIGSVVYPFDLDEKTQKLVPNEERAAKTLDIIDKYMAGESTNKISKYLQSMETTDKNWRANTILRILRNPALCGDTRWVDKVYKNTHPGIISRDKFDKLQIMIKERTWHHKKEVKIDHLFQGILNCPSCDKKLSVNRFIRKRVDGSFHTNSSYKCMPCARDKKYNNSIVETKFLDALLKYMKDLKLKEVDVTKADDKKVDWNKELLNMERKRSRYQRAWADELMTDDEFKKRMDETKAAYDELKEKAKEEAPKQLDVKQANKVIYTFNQNFKELTRAEKRSFISTFIKGIKFKVVNHPPVRPDQSAKGSNAVEVVSVIFY